MGDDDSNDSGEINIDELKEAIRAANRDLQMFNEDDNRDTSRPEYQELHDKRDIMLNRLRIEVDENEYESFVESLNVETDLDEGTGRDAEEIPPESLDELVWPFLREYREE